MTGISVVKELYKILKSDDDLVKITKGQIYPVVSEIDVKFPYVIFGKHGLSTETTKSGLRFDRVTINFLVAAKTYSEAVDIAERIRTLLEFKRDDYFIQISLQDVTDDFDFSSDAYTQQLNFQILTTYKK